MDSDFQKKLRYLRDKGYVLSFGIENFSKSRDRVEIEHLPDWCQNVLKGDEPGFSRGYSSFSQFRAYILYLLDPEWADRAPEIQADKWKMYRGKTPNECLDEIWFEHGLKQLANLMPI